MIAEVHYETLAFVLITILTIRRNMNVAGTEFSVVDAEDYNVVYYVNADTFVVSSEKQSVNLNFYIPYDVSEVRYCDNAIDFDTPDDKKLFTWSKVEGQSIELSADETLKIFCVYKDGRQASYTITMQAQEGK